MSIPEGLTIDLSEGFDSLIVECEAGDTDCESFSGSGHRTEQSRQCLGTKVDEC